MEAFAAEVHLLKAGAAGGKPVLCSSGEAQQIEQSTREELEAAQAWPQLQHQIFKFLGICAVS